MTTFQIKDEFYLNDEKFKIISGSIHYFRIVPEYWQDRLEKLKMMGCNTIETYIPWNVHEQHEGEYSFEGINDIRHFIKLAQALDLYVIIRPATYICAEWEFGGQPYWLTTKSNLRLRANNEEYFAAMKTYYDHLFPQLIDLQVTHGGPIILMQVDNEYGAYGNDKTYLYRVADLMKSEGVDVPLVTSDGPWNNYLENGSIPDVALPTINCGSDVKDNFERLRKFHGKKRPLMVMEFWVGWFDAWGDPKHHTTDSIKAAKELDDTLSEGSVNIYMLIGGTNFGYMNGANYYDKLLPDVTSYDYDSPLTEWGDLTPKFYEFQKVISKYRQIPEVILTTKIKKKNYGRKELTNKVSLFETLAQIAQPIEVKYPSSMESYHQGYGYTLYSSHISTPKDRTELQLLGANDRAQIFMNQELKATQYDLELTHEIEIPTATNSQKLDILIENMGRVNYSHIINHQQKGISEGVLVDKILQSHWQVSTLPLDNIDQVDYTKDWVINTPAFYQFKFKIDETGDTFIDMRGWGKGVVFVNNKNIGRFWEIGPQARLYIPGPLLKSGENTIVIFETEGKSQNSIELVDEPKLSI